MAIHCSRCGVDNQDQAKFCTNCGQDLTQPTYHYQVPPKSNTDVMTIGQYLLTFLLLSIPIANIVMMIIWSVTGSTNKNLQNMARALWIWVAIWTAVTVVLWVVLVRASSAMFYTWDAPIWDGPMMEAPWYDTFNHI
ncbi:MAG: zinc ribbon domain-containing protein [Clostridiales bacterium]|nr:zinc ribbon domain-containing protein [Clostridiales bacterium]